MGHLPEKNNTIEYLVVGHVTRDKVESNYIPGGTVTYSGQLAKFLGCRTSVLTSAREDYDLRPILDGIEVCKIPAEQDTIFSNIYNGNNRIQLLHSRANDIMVADVPQSWMNAEIVHLGPLTNEVDPNLIDLFPNSLVGITPQGWMRRWGDDGRVFAASFPAEETLLKKADVTVISEEDLLDDDMYRRYIKWANILVVTQNFAGCTVYVAGEEYQIPAPPITVVESTGAGDIFAAAFFIGLHRSGHNPIQAAEFANHVAAHSVTKTSLQEKVNAWRDVKFK
ncbi:MAG: sugar/nucleoside kinase (ribokinase family) [Candidatus Promineifilaceae bacterium]